MNTRCTNRRSTWFTPTFDRLLVAVALAEQLTLLTADARLLALNETGLIKAV
jgi:hypothetical protein